MKVFAVAAIFLALAVPVERACAQRLLVTTAATSPAGQAADAHLQIVDMDRLAVVSGPVKLPGKHLGKLPLVNLAGTYVLATSMDSPARALPPAGDSRSYLTALPLSDRPAFHSQRLVSLPGWRYVGAAQGFNENTGQYLLAALTARYVDDTRATGHIDVYQWDPAAVQPLSLMTPMNLLPGPPVDWAMLHDRRTLVVLCQHPVRPRAILHALNLTTENIEAMTTLELDDYQFGSTPTGIAVSGDGRYLFALTSGYALSDPGGEPTSWLHVFDTQRLEAVSGPLVIPGVARPEDRPILADTGSGCWIATASPGADFAYVTKVTAGPSSAETAVQVPFTGVHTGLRIAQSPNSPAVAVAAERRLELWPEGLPGSAPVEYDAPIHALAWTETGLYLGEGGRVHRIRPGTAEAYQSLQLQTGLVREILPLPKPESDSEKFSLPDEPLEAGTVPVVVTFRGEAAGHELRSFRLDAEAFAGRKWRIAYDDNNMPWLRIFPLTGTAPSRIVMGIDPVQYSSVQQRIVTGNFDLHLLEKDGSDSLGKPATVYIQIAPDRSLLRKILWIWPDREGSPRMRSARDPYGMRGLADLLSSAPYHFTHTESWGAAPGSLDEYTIVVLGSAVASRGAITRQALLDYVAAGGALLVLGSYDAEPASPGFARWLEPLGIEFDLSTRIDGAFARSSDHELCKNWTGFSIRNGCTLHTTSPATPLVARDRHSDEAVFVRSAYGLGRVAVLAAATPLESRALNDGGHARFAGDLFRWLARARHEIDDQDGDGLSDYTEDRNDNGIADPGETDYLSADTDRDGLPDPMEDVNRNGLNDEGELNPLNPDSDGDGIVDGADAYPLPPAAAPVIAAVEPAVGPAEGGSFVVVNGRNFTPETTLWFGRRRSTRLRTVDSGQIIAMTPPHENTAGGAVEIRTLNPSTGLAGALPEGFVYRERSTLNISLSDLPESEMGPGAVLILDAPDIALGRGSIILSAEPREAVRKISFVANNRLGRMNTGIESLVLPEGRLLLDFAPWALLGGGGNVGTIRWTVSAGHEDDDVTFSVREAYFTAGNDVPIGTAVVPEPLLSAPPGPGR